MGAISDFVTAFICKYEEYRTIEKELEAVCSKALRPGIEFLWQSRVKTSESLERKLRARVKDYENESKNVADVKDLVAGRIILARWRDFQHVEEIVKQEFIYISQTQHPKHAHNAVNFKARFRGYDGLHFYVKLRHPSAVQSIDPVIEIQVMSLFMCALSMLDHDITYKKLSGEPDEALLRSLDLLKGIANLGEIALQTFDTQFLPVAKSSIHKSDISPNLQATIRSVATEVKFDENDKKCLRDLRLTDPRDDKTRIEAGKDQLLEGSCSWVLEDPAFVRWWSQDDFPFLWIHGDPGKGKTMMTIALISEVSKRLDHQPGSNVVAYFFCQNTSDHLNTAVSVLRGLIYLVVDQEKKLIHHIRNRYDSTGRRLFEDENALYALRGVLLDILKDRSLGNVYLLVDALDECDPKIHEILRWIIGEASALSPKIKWLVTSRNEPAFIERLGRGQQLHTSLELNSSHVTRAVGNFIDYKVKHLAALKSYSQELQSDIGIILREKAEGTFLWVALVCKELERVRAQKAKLHLRTFPAGLEPLFARMLSIVINQEDKEDAKLCIRILCSVTLAFRPLRLEETSPVKEIAFFAQLPRHSSNIQALTDLIDRCGSFITIRQGTIYFIHQSAKDYLSGSSIFDSEAEFGQSHQHDKTAHLCLRLLSMTLKRNICRMKTPSTSIRDIEIAVLNRNLPSRMQYACQYWVRHVQNGILTDDRVQGVYDFLRIHFLHWLEALSLMGKTSETVSLVGQLESIPKVSST